jgi:NAD(P)-dependent dehydrogenase (short-subunit alcohol dehydrogenase family)
MATVSRNETAVTGDPYARDLAGTRAVVTGGTRGIGAAIAGTLARRGAEVLISARNQAADLPEGVRLVVADAATPEGAERVAAEAHKVLGEVGVLVNNAGGGTPVPGGISSIADEQWQAAIAANLLSAVRLDRLLIPGMRARRRGAIVHISSSSARQPVGQIAHYAAAKAALTNNAKALALELAPDGVRVNTVSPGMTMTSAVQDALGMMAKAQGVDVEIAKQALIGQMGGIPLAGPATQPRSRSLLRSWCRTALPGSLEVTSPSTAVCGRRSELMATVAGRATARPA